MADKDATDAAAKKAAEKNVNLSDVEGSGSGGKVTAQDVAAIEERFSVRVNPALGSYLYDTGDRVFYRDPNNNPEGPEAQMLTEEEYSDYSAESNGVKVLVKGKGA